MSSSNICEFGRAAMVALSLMFLAFAEPVLAQGTPAATDASTAKQREAVEKLRTGGYTVYIRHTQTDSKTEDKDLSDMSNCAGQRVLSDQGRENAGKLGDAVKALAIPVGDVITSQFCRAKDTA